MSLAAHAAYLEYVIELTLMVMTSSRICSSVFTGHI